jgi:hypothetical protein
MTEEEVLVELCSYDKRNPNCSYEDDEIQEHKARLLKDTKKLGYEQRCPCDNCFYRRTRLAEEILKLLKNNIK